MHRPVLSNGNDLLIEIVAIADRDAGDQKAAAGIGHPRDSPQTLYKAEDHVSTVRSV